MIHIPRRRMTRAAIVIGLSQFLGVASAWAQSCAALDPGKAARCRGLEEQEKILSANCRVPGAATAEQAASICAQVRAKVQADKRALFSDPTPAPRAQPALAGSPGVQPLPVTSAPAKLPVLRGFYIGMPMQQALAAASIALAPLSAVHTHIGTVFGRSRIYLKSGLDECIADERKRRNRPAIPTSRGGIYTSDQTEFPSLEQAQDTCLTYSSRLQFVFETDDRTQTLTGITITENYVLDSHGYNVREAKLSFDEFAKLMGQRLGVPVKLGRSENPITECSGSGANIFDLGTTVCKTKKNIVTWYTAVDPKTCKCNLQFGGGKGVSPFQMYMTPLEKPSNPDAVR